LETIRERIIDQQEEHSKPQRFKISVWCDIASNTSGQTDELKETFNYETLRSIIQKNILGEHKKLLETLAENIAQGCLQYSLVDKVEVKITKPDIWGDCEPGVWVIRE
jgi:dihydroneopterin aldolase